MKRALLLIPIAATAVLSSCTAIHQAGDSSLAKISQISERIRPVGVKVVEVREQDLKELPTGHERALAFNQSRKRNFWNFEGPVNFEEPSLPGTAGEMDGSLLPPKDL